MNAANLVNNYYPAKSFVHYLSLFIKNEQAIKSEQSPLIAILRYIARLIKNEASDLQSEAIRVGDLFKPIDGTSSS